jgi:hypothetical protein
MEVEIMEEGADARAGGKDATHKATTRTPNAQEDLELGAEHMASIVLQCRLRAKELGEDLCEVDFDGKLGRLSVNDLSPKLQRMQELVVRFTHEARRRQEGQGVFTCRSR